MVPDDDPDGTMQAASRASERATDVPAAFRDVVAGDEPLRATLRCPDGYDCPDGPADAVAGPLTLGVTDRRVLVVPAEEHPDAGTAADADAVGSRQASLSLPFTELGAVSLAGGGRPVLELVSADKVTYRLPLAEGTGRATAAVADLRWIGEVRGRVLASTQEVTAAADHIEELAAEGALEPALQTYERARTVLDTLLDTVHGTTPVAATHLAPGLTDVERALEAAVTRTYVTRARAHLDAVEEHIAAHDFEAARTSLEAAREDRTRAELHAAEVFRREEFRFGLERDLEETLRELGWEIEAVAAEPIRRAQEAVVDAQACDDAAEAAAHYEDAVRDFRGLLPLGWREGPRQFDGDPTAVREDLQRTARQLLACHRSLASEHREAMRELAGGDAGGTADDGSGDGESGEDGSDDAAAGENEWAASPDEGAGSERAEAGDAGDAASAVAAAEAHLERARELARDFDPDAVAEIDNSLVALRAEAEDRGIDGG